jgi:hypothetical protein
MNNFYQAVNLIKERVENNPLVNTVIFARTEEKDLYKKSIFPIVHINPIENPYKNSSVRLYTFEVGVFEQRNINNENTETKFEGNDNVLDNLNVCDAILNDLVTYLETQNNNDNIFLDSVSSASPLIFKDYNILDGWVIRITLMTPNNVISVC